MAERQKHSRDVLNGSKFDGITKNSHQPVRELATIEECAGKAADYRKRTDKATTEAVKLAYLELARTWEDHAHDLKRSAKQPPTESTS